MLNISDNNKQTYCNAQLTAKLMQQVSLREGLRRFGEEGNRAALAEMEQLCMRDTFKPVLLRNLIPEKKKEVLESIMLLKQKRDGTIKGRNCADGRKQREFTSKEEAASPTVKLESVFLTSVIEAHEGRDVTTIDIPNAFIQNKIENEADKVVMRMRGKLAEYLVLIAPQIYKPYVVFENGKKVLYCEAQNAIYGTLKAALLFYKKLLKDLIEFGFEINPYDVCVANIMINGKQMTTLFHVDDMKVSHMDHQEISIFINWLKSKYEVDGLNKLKATRGKVHDFLGMKLDFSKSGKVIIDMKEYVQNMINDFSVNLEDSSSNTPAGDWLFETRNNSKNLNDNMAQEFHTMVAKGLFLCKCARPDIQTTIAFLTTRVKEPDEDDWKKLLRMMRYLNGSKDLVLTLSADGTGICKWYIDASYAVHNDLKGHTGSAMTMGKGSIQSKSIKQELNTKSSTESELVETDDILPDALWTGYFLKAQGYESTKSIIAQDNKSAMLLETNGPMSSSKRTKHINIRYFLLQIGLQKEIYLCNIVLQK